MSKDDTDRGRIFRLAAHDKVQGTPILKALEQRWWGLARPGSLPRRRDVTASMIGDALPHAFIIERIATGHARMRVAGRKLSDLVGTEARGMPLSTLIDPGSRSDLSGRLEAAFARPAIVDVPVFAPRALGRPALKGRLLILPLEGDDGSVDRALGAVLLDGAIGRRPRRLQIDPTADWRCDPVDRRAADPALQRINSRLSELAPPRAPGHPFLRLVVNNDA